MSKSKEPRFYTHWEDEYWMSSNDFYCGLNMPDALKGEEEHGLPPFAKRKGFLVDEYPACPQNWMRSEGKLTSYFVGIQKDKGLWLDFNKNADKKHHVAIVVSIQGINPITGMPCSDAHLEQYIETCPKCKKTFGPNRHCESCGYKWPKQNYICTTATPEGMLWLDGFRTIDGVVRQYILSEEKIKGVAAGIIGSKRVFAIGVSFFLSKNPKPVVIQPHAYRGIITNDTITTGTPAFYSPVHTTVDWKHSGVRLKGGKCLGGVTKSSSSASYASSSSSSVSDCNSLCSLGEAGEAAYYGDLKGTYADVTKAYVDVSSVPSRTVKVNRVASVKTKKMEVGAGANIRQAVYDDPEPLDYWREEPESVLCVNYCLEEEAIQIIKQGKVDLSGHKEGFLQKIAVGN